jgi:hypothetical protein
MTVPRKTCRDCKRDLPRTRRFFYTTGTHADGSARWDSYCRRCRRARTRRSWQARRSTPEGLEAMRAYYRENKRTYRALHPEAEKEARKRRWARIVADPKRHRQVNRNRRRYVAKLRAPYRPPHKNEVVPAAPLRTFLVQRFPGWESFEIAAVAHHAVSPRLLYRVFHQQAQVLELDAVDRLLTAGLGRPDLLNTLYPRDGSAQNGQRL